MQEEEKKVCEVRKPACCCGLCLEMRRVVAWGRGCGVQVVLVELVWWNGQIGPGTGLATDPGSVS